MPNPIPLNEGHLDGDANHTDAHNDLAHYLNLAFTGTFLSASSASSFERAGLSSATAANIAATYLTNASASSTYVTQTAAASTYALLIESVNAVPTSGSAQVVPSPIYNSISRIVLTANCTLTFPSPVAGLGFTLTLVQDGTGSRTVTWPGTAKWAGGTAPTLSTGANKVDYFSFVCTDGATWSGFTAGLDIR